MNALKAVSRTVGHQVKLEAVLLSTLIVRADPLDPFLSKDGKAPEGSGPLANAFKFFISLIIFIGIGAAILRIVYVAAMAVWSSRLGLRDLKTPVISLVILAGISTILQVFYGIFTAFLSVFK